MPRVYVSIGSNVEPEKQVRFAVSSLRQFFGDLIESPVYRTNAIGFKGPDFLNMVVAFDSGQSAEQIHDRLNSIERESGRLKSDKQFASRTLDLDMLLYGNEVIDSLRIPRDEIARYAFVLKPLCDISPELLHPVSQKSMCELWEDFDLNGQELKAVQI
ncbi:MAG: 2-amino-4-hydroxy-6-hydroxymethyldihydropteridine diphosphokinase [Gammaproteobacteria bacterium]|nr:2-amino-4-hydroxy-6-hydroxymethyldihydropteridine diphosphokinase [Gammaproteobacteria bacterium]